jgi:hypothetical protein
LPQVDPKTSKLFSDRDFRPEIPFFMAVQNRRRFGYPYLGVFAKNMDFLLNSDVS